MGAIQAAKALGHSKPPTYASATNMNVKANDSFILISGSTAVVTIKQPGKAGQLLRVQGASGASFTLTNNNDTTTAGQMDLGGSNITTFGSGPDVIVLRKRADGSWERLFNENN